MLRKMIYLLVLFLSNSCEFEKDTTIEYTYEQPSESIESWEVSSLSDVNIDQSQIELLTNKILSNEYTDIHSMLIIRNGKLAYEEYFNGFDANDFHVLFSATKSYASTLIGIVIDQGMIESVDEPLVDLLQQKDSLFSDGKNEIRLRDLLTMSAGLEWDEWTTSSTSIANSHEQMMRASSQINFVIEQPLLDEPGTTFTYSTGLSNLMAPIIENASGLDLEVFAENNLLTPLGITNYRWNTVIDDYPSTGGSRGGLEMIPRDMAKLGQLFLDGGQWEGEQIVSENWVNEALSAKINQSTNINYSYQWWNRTYFRKDGAEVLEYDAVGDGGQWIFIFPELDLVVAFTGGNYTWVKGPDLMFQPINMIQQYILPAVN